MSRNVRDELSSWFVAGMFIIGFATLAEWILEEVIEVQLTDGWAMLLVFVAAPLIFHFCIGSLIRYYGPTEPKV